MDVGQERRCLGVNTEHLVHRIGVEAILESLRVPLRLEIQNFATQLRLRIEVFSPELALQFGQILLFLLQIEFHRFVGNIVQLIVVRFDPEL